VSKNRRPEHNDHGIGARGRAQAGSNRKVDVDPLTKIARPLPLAKTQRLSDLGFLPAMAIPKRMRSCSYDPQTLRKKLC